MGLAAAAAVTVAVLVALTLLPAIALLLGERLRPRRTGPPAIPGRAGRRHRGAAEPRDRRPGLPTRWVRLVTRVPLLTVALVVGWPAGGGDPRPGPRAGAARQQHRSGVVAAAADLRRHHRSLR